SLPGPAAEAGRSWCPCGGLGQGPEVRVAKPGARDHRHREETPEWSFPASAATGSSIIERHGGLACTVSVPPAQQPGKPPSVRLTKKARGTQRRNPRPVGPAAQEGGAAGTSSATMVRP